MIYSGSLMVTMGVTRWGLPPLEVCMPAAVGVIRVNQRHLGDEVLQWETTFRESHFGALSLQALIVPSTTSAQPIARK